MTLPEWSTAKTLADLGDLTQQFILGELSETPIHGGPLQEQEDVVDELLRINAAGIVTFDSQPGDEGQRAYVEAMCDEATAGLLMLSLNEHPTYVLMWFEPETSSAASIGVSTRGSDHGTFLGRWDWEDLARHYADESPELRDAMRHGWGLQAFDPAWGGGNGLFVELARAADWIREANG